MSVTSVNSPKLKDILFIAIKEKHKSYNQHVSTREGCVPNSQRCNIYMHAAITSMTLYYS